MIMYAGGAGICINTHNYYYSLMYHPVSSAQQAAPPSHHSSQQSLERIPPDGHDGHGNS